MNILFLECETPVAIFIDRRIKELIKTPTIKIILFSELNGSEEITTASISYKYKINLRENFKLSLIRLAKTFPYNIIRTYKTIKYAPKNLSFIKKLYFSVYFNELAGLNIDIIHLQYIGQFILYDWLKDMYKVPFISSSRGAQVTYMPETIPGYIDKIRRAFNGSDYIHCVSLSLKNRCIELGASNDKLFVNYNGIATDKFVPNKHVKNAEKFRFITVGSLTWRKGLLFQLLALQKCINQNKLINYELMIIGKGPENQNIDYYARKLSIRDHIVLLGEKSENEIVHYLQSANVYLTTSVAEGLSNSVMEALSCGLPVISFDCEGASELISENSNGIVVDFGDIDKFVAAMTKLSTDENLLALYSGNARYRMIKSFDINYHVTEMVNFYNSLIL